MNNRKNCWYITTNLKTCLNNLKRDEDLVKATISKALSDTHNNTAVRNAIDNIKSFMFYRLLDESFIVADSKLKQFCNTEGYLAINYRYFIPTSFGVILYE